MKFAVNEIGVRCSRGQHAFSCVSQELADAPEEIYCPVLKRHDGIRCYASLRAKGVILPRCIQAILQAHRKCYMFTSQARALRNSAHLSSAIAVILLNTSGPTVVPPLFDKPRI